VPDVENVSKIAILVLISIKMNLAPAIIKIYFSIWDSFEPSQISLIVIPVDSLLNYSKTTTPITRIFHGYGNII